MLRQHWSELQIPWELEPAPAGTFRLPLRCLYAVTFPPEVPAWRHPPRPPSAPRSPAFRGAAALVVPAQPSAWGAYGHATTARIALANVKPATRARMKQLGLPVIPGSEGPVRTAAEALRIAEAIGYPVMLKAKAGGAL